jgi:hypothetical protein
MNKDLYLLWAPNQGWGVFNSSSCPDPEAFPDWMYKKYTIPGEKYDKLFEKLIELKERLCIEKIIPAKVKEKDIFPELSDLLKE